MATLDPEPRTPSLVFIGFMGAGKTKAARAAAIADGVEPLDTDDLLAAELGMAIDEFFEREGEAEFRRREEALVLGVLERAAGEPIALGGGSVQSERVRAALERHTTVWLEIDPGEAWERVEGSVRPLARDRGRFEALLAERRPLYESVARAVLPGRRDVVRRALPALAALRELPEGTRMAWGRSASGEYPVFVGRGLIDGSPATLATAGVAGLSGAAALVTDAAVGPLYGARLGTFATSIDVPPGERAKTLAEAERIWHLLAQSGLTRADHVVALGGGVVGDLAGFCAATYQRGVPVLQVPTTLVAQVDSAYGGKTGVDLPEAKNYVGAYHLPAAVLADPATLETLPAPELAAGWVEVVKTALLADGGLWERVRAVEQLDPASLDDVIFACARFKLDVVAADERDSGVREMLNLGHTVGHGIEAATGYGRYRHGEAVGLGLLAALRLSGAGQLRGEVAEILARQGLPVELDPDVPVERVMDAVARDKKRTADGVGFILLDRPGEPLTGQLVDPARVREAVEEIRG